MRTLSKVVLATLIAGCGLARGQAPVVVDRAEAAVLLRQCRALVAAGDWTGLCRAAKPLLAMPVGVAVEPDQPDDQLDQTLMALRELLGVPPTVPTNDATKGLLADELDVAEVAAVHYRAHLERGEDRVWSERSLFAGYLAHLAVRRGDLAAARDLLVEQVERQGRTGTQPWHATAERHLQSLDALLAAPDDPWRQLAFCRAYWGTAAPPYRQAAHFVRAQLRRLLQTPAAVDPVLRLAIRCEEFASWPVTEGLRDPRALPVARICVDQELLAVAALRQDGEDAWTPVWEMGAMLQQAGEATRAVVAFDALIDGWKPPAGAPARLVRAALVAGAECQIGLGQLADALARLDRAEAEFPFRSGCGTCDLAEARRVAALRKRAGAPEQGR